MTSKKPKTPRAPYTDHELETLDLVGVRLTDEETIRMRQINLARQARWKQEHAERDERLKVEAAPLLADLRAVGFEADSHWDVNGKVEAHTEIIPVLLKHLVLPYSDAIKNGLSRALAIPHPAVRKAWPVLMKEYRNAPEGQGIIAAGDTEPRLLGAKEGLANTLVAAVTEKTLPELITLVQDRSLGESRVLLLRPLRRRRNKNPLVKQVLEELANDPELAKEIASWR